MVEQDIGPKITYEKAPSTIFLRRIVPHKVSIAIADKILGQGLSVGGHRHLKLFLKKILIGEHIQIASVLPVYQDADFKFETAGEENIPTSGTTLFIANHEKSRIIGGMGHFIEAARVAYEARSDVRETWRREPRVIFQRGLTCAVRLPGGKKFVWMAPLTEQFYQLAAESFNWVVVDPPKHDRNDQITNKQNLPPCVTEQLLDGRAQFWFPQGKDDQTSSLFMPQKASDYITNLKQHDIAIIPVIFERGRLFSIRFGPPIHIQDLPLSKDGKLNLNDFAQKHMAPLLTANRPS